MLANVGAFARGACCRASVRGRVCASVRGRVCACVPPRACACLCWCAFADLSAWQRKVVLVDILSSKREGGREGGSETVRERERETETETETDHSDRRMHERTVAGTERGTVRLSGGSGLTAVDAPRGGYERGGFTMTDGLLSDCDGSDG